MYCSCDDHPDGAFWTKSGHFKPYDELFIGQKVQLGTVGDLKTTWFAQNRPFRSHQGGPKGPKMGQWCLPWKHWPIGPLCGVWNPIWCHTRHPDGQKLRCRGQADPHLTTLDHSIDHPKPSQTPLIPFSDFPHNQYHPSSYLTTQ